MEFELLRIDSQEESSIGVLFAMPEELDRRIFLGFILEDAKREKKVYGKTRIPAGRYKLALRTDGKMHADYAKKFPSMHRGMIWILEVPNYSYCYIHIGNTVEDTLGCPLIGYTASHSSSTIGQSKIAYEAAYPIIAGAIESQENVYLRVLDFDSSIATD